MKNMINEKSWKEFKDSGLLWWINNLLHTFGWAIVFENDMDGNIVDVYPARVLFRGFDEKTTTEGHKKLSKYMHNNHEELLKEANGDYEDN